MAKADHIKALIRSHADGDDARFYAVAMQMAAQAARAGQANVAQELRGLIDKAKAGATRTEDRSPKAVPLAQPRGELAALLAVRYPKTRLGDLAVNPELRRRLERVLREHRQRARLQSYGFAPQRKLLLIGPPGTGKTMTAAAVAAELGLPLFTVRLDGLITKFMGETAAKLRMVFDAIAETRGVYLFDEFDALGSNRALANDVGEMRRILNSFLQFIEQDESDSLLIAATNHPELLDHALFRRFDGAFEYRLPTDDIAIEVMQGRLAFLDTSTVDWGAVVPHVEGLSHAEITRACEQAAKDALLDDSTVVRTESLIFALDDRRRLRR